MSLFSRRKLRTQVEKVEKVENTSKAESAVAAQENSEELVAVITAAIMNMLSINVKGDLHIKSIRRVGIISPVWNIAGRNEYIASKL